MEVQYEARKLALQRVLKGLHTSCLQQSPWLLVCKMDSDGCEGAFTGEPCDST